MLALFLLGHCASRLFPSGYESLWLCRAGLTLPSQGSPFYSLSLLVERVPGCFLPSTSVFGRLDVASWEVRLPCSRHFRSPCYRLVLWVRSFPIMDELRLPVFRASFPTSVGYDAPQGTWLCLCQFDRIMLFRPHPILDQVQGARRKEREIVGATSVISLCPWSTLILAPLAEFRMRFLGSLLLDWTLQALVFPRRVCSSFPFRLAPVAHRC